MIMQSLRFLPLVFAWASLSAVAASAPKPPELAPLLAKPLYQFNETETGFYLGHLQATEPDLRKRIVHLARKNIGQPYDIYLLGELPFETYDPQPIYCLTKSDCLVFTEHVYAMALSRDWTGFMRLLQRIRYRDGRLGVATRNHYTEADWNVSNRWLVRDLTAELAGAKAVPFAQKIDRPKFLLNRYGLKAPAPIEDFRDTFIPLDALDLALPQLRDGDFVNVVRASIAPGGHANTEIYGGQAWVGHTGFVAHGPDGTVNIIHSAEPAVREESFAQFIAHAREKAAAPGAKQRLVGFKFFRLADDPMANLRKIDGPDAPRVTLPGGAGF
jgi:hypothetical protein